MVCTTGRTGTASERVKGSLVTRMSAATVPIHIIFIVILFTLLSLHSSLEAANAKKELSEIQKQIQSKKEQVKESIKKEKTVLERIEDINQSIKEKTVELKKYDTRIAGTAGEILTLSREVDNIHTKLESRQDYLKERLRALYKQQYGGNALVLISAKDYQDLIKKSKYISLIAYYDSKVINKYGYDIRELNSKKLKLEDLNNKLRADKEQVQKTQKALQTDRIKKDKLLAMIRSKRSSYEQSIKELEESSKKLRDMISKMKMKTLPKSITGKGFTSLKGRLPWPVNGSIATPYGQYEDPEFKITVFKNGIEISPDKGEKPKAIAGGRVVYADWFKGYGLLLIIDHGGGYHSLYGNLSEIFLKTGDILIEGTVVGKIGNSQLLDYPTLYFEIRYRGKPVNPEEWLRRARVAGKKIRIK